MLLTIGIGLLSLASALLPALGLLALYVLAETWRPPIDPPGWFRTAYRLSRYYVFTVLIMIAFFCPVNAGEKATRDECVAKAKEAGDLIKAEGLEAAITKIQDQAGPFVWKDTYVFLMDLDGKMLAHPVTPKLVGKTLIGLKDINGKMFVNEYIVLANDKGEGWVDYMWPKVGEKTPSKKLTYIYRVPGQSLIACAGIYE